MSEENQERRLEEWIYRSHTDGELNRALDGVIDTSSHQLFVVPGWAWWIHSTIDLPQQSWQQWPSFSCRLRVMLLWSSRCLCLSYLLTITQSKAASVTYRCLLLSFRWEGSEEKETKSSDRKREQLLWNKGLMIGFKIVWSEEQGIKQDGKWSEGDRNLRKGQLKKEGGMRSWRSSR